MPSKRWKAPERWNINISKEKQVIIRREKLVILSKLNFDGLSDVVLDELMRVLEFYSISDDDLDEFIATGKMHHE